MQRTNSEIALPVFRNRENKVFTVNDNGKERQVWESRSVAVHGILVVRVKGEDYLLLTKRSENCPDEIGKYANVTGYLDWDEDAIGALKREYWEEASLHFDKYFNETNLVFGNMVNPYSVKTKPTASRQNVTLRFPFVFEVDELPPVQKTVETSEVRFVPISEVIDMIEKDSDSFAWDHARIIKEILMILYTKKGG